MMRRKRHIVVYPAYVQDRDSARLVLKELADRFPRLRLTWLMASITVPCRHGYRSG